jgi:ABC-type branched-subunit amino acid transport system substrate-binding protein/DNA-binding SARP family transcriptional activator
VEFRVLGPLEVIDGGVPLALGGPRQRLVLASLILDANRVVPTDRLIDRIWGDEPPDAVRATLFAYISRLRKLFGAGRIQARPPGYILVAERDEIDLFRFTDLVDAARRQTEDRETSAALLTQALDLWRGGALSDLADYDALRPGITRLEELRLGALEDRIEADIALGRHRESVALLEGLTTEYPLRERLWSHLILALYRSGRQGDALGAFHRARTTLVEELGIDPSPDLRRLEVQVLNQDPALDLPTSPMAPPSSAPEPPASAPADRPSDGRRRRYLISAGVLLVLVAAAAWWARQSPQGLPQSRWTIGLEMPLSGANVSYGVAIRKAVQMAVDEVNAAGGVGGSTLDLKVYDDAPAMELAPQSARALVDDPAAIAMIGPFLSAAAFPVLPITNQAGLLQCSPSNTHPGLTKPRYGALDLRATHPDARNYVRLAPADDIQAVALASFAYRDLAARSALVIDETGAGGREVADAFEVEFGQLGGTTLRRSLNPGADPLGVLEPLDDELNPARLVFFVGSLDTGAAVRVAMADADHLATPLLSWDALLIGSGFQLGEPYIEQTGTAAVGSYVAHASLPDQKFSFADAYRQEFGNEPDEYSAAGYACVEIIVAAMRGIAAEGPAVDEVRDLIRAYVVDPAHQYETALGTVRFDANGDAVRQFVTFYRAVTSATTGGAAWVVFKKQDFGPAP